MKIDLSRLITAEDKFKQRKESKKNEVEAWFSTMEKPLLKEYPEIERDSWPQQYDEAVAYLEDNEADTPLLDGLCAGRLDDKQTLAQKILANRQAFAAAGLAIGTRKRLLKAIDACDTQEQLDAVSVPGVEK